MKKIFLALTLLLFLNLNLTPALAVGQATSYRAAQKVGECFGQWFPMTNGYTRTYEDATLRTLTTVTYLLGGGVNEDIKVWRKPDNTLVGHWNDGVKLTFLPDGSWEVYLLNLSRTCDGC